MTSKRSCLLNAIAIGFLCCGISGCSEDSNPIVWSMRDTSKKKPSDSTEDQAVAQSGRTNQADSSSPYAPSGGAFQGQAAPRRPVGAGAAVGPPVTRDGPETGRSGFGSAPPPSVSTQGSSSQGSQQGNGQTTSSSSSRFPIELRRPVSLGQTGPNGIMMSFSVEYQYLNGTPISGKDYYLVIRSQEGRYSDLQISPMQSRGVLNAVIESWRPEYGPFTAVIEERDAAGGNRELSKRTKFIPTGLQQ